MTATKIMWLLKIKNSVTQLNNHTWSAVTKLDSGNKAHFHHHRKVLLEITVLQDAIKYQIGKKHQYFEVENRMAT